MIDDELQVLGKPRKISKQEKWKLAIIAIALLASVVILGMVIHFYVSSQQPEKIKTGEEMGNSTINPSLQHATDSLLRTELELINGLHGQVIVMEVQTGKILSMVGLERNFEGKYQPCENFAYQQVPGSTMKTASLLAVLETGKAKLSNEVNVGNGVWPVDEWTMKDHNWRRGGYGTVTLERALEVSSNVGISRTVAKIFGGNPQEYFDRLNKMSFGQPDSIEGIRGLKPMTYSSPKDADWASWKLWWSAIGYERMMTPIQMLTFYNAIANGGKMVKPTLKTGEIEIINPQIASKANIDSMQVALEHVVSQGLGRKAGTPILSVAGKTSTAQANQYEYGEESYVDEFHILFCGYFPADAPQYSIIVSMNKLGLPASGGGMAGVVFHDIVEWMITHGMPNATIIDEKTGDTIRITPNNVDSILNK